MIEVERKFVIHDQQKKQLLGDAHYVGEKTFTDIYYDTPEYTLTKNDVWLRSRAGVFQLKISLNRDINRQADQHDELETEQDIRKAIHLPAQATLEEDLASHGYQEIVVCTTKRVTYKKGDFTIDIDEVHYQDGSSYHLLEVELLVDDASQMEQAIARIMAFANEQKLDSSPVGGKVHFYIKHHRPEHFAFLVKEGVLRDV